MIKKTSFLFLFIFLSQSPVKALPSQDDYALASNDAQPESPEDNECHDELDGYADRQEEFLDKPTGITHYAKQFIFSNSPLWLKKMIASLFITLNKFPDYANAQWEYVKRTFSL